MARYKVEVPILAQPDKSNQPPAAAFPDKAAPIVDAPATAEKQKAPKFKVQEGLRVQFTINNKSRDITKKDKAKGVTMKDIIARTTEFKHRFQMFFQPLVFKAELKSTDSNPVHIVRSFLSVLRYSGWLTLTLTIVIWRRRWHKSWWVVGTLVVLGILSVQNMARGRKCGWMQCIRPRWICRSTFFQQKEGWCQIEFEQTEACAHYYGSREIDVLRLCFCFCFFFGTSLSLSLCLQCLWRCSPLCFELLFGRSWYVQTDWNTPFRHRANEEIIYMLSKCSESSESGPNTITFQFTLNVSFAQSSDVCTSQTPSKVKCVSQSDDLCLWFDFESWCRIWMKALG